MKPSQMLCWVVGIYLLIIPFCAQPQVNTSSKTSYKQRIVKTNTDYSSEYDNGYAKLRDGTVLSGQISISGPTFENIQIVKIRTNGGDKYVFRMPSLMEYGLRNNLINDTPDLFTWSAPMPKSAFTGFQDVRSGECNYGYVNTKDGKKYLGNLTVKEANGRVEYITVKDDKKKTTKIDADNITNFGAQQYADKKFEGVWSLVPWRTPKATGLLVNIKTEPMRGVVILNDGKELKGKVTLFKKEEMITQIEVAPESGGKEVRVKYPEVKSYRMEQRVKDYDKVLRTEDTPYELIPPARKFFPGKVLLVDGTLKEGLVAKAADRTYTDIYYAPNESGLVEGIPSADVEVAIQDIPEQTIKDYKKLIFDRDYVMGYRIQRPPQWIYKSQTGGGGGLSKLSAMTESQTSETEWQQGYIILPDGKKKVGALSVLSLNGQITLGFKVEGKEKEKIKDFKEYGLIESQPKTEFPATLFKKKSDGFVVLIGSDKFIIGPLEIVTKTDPKTGNESTNFIVGEEKYNAANVDLYGLLNVPARQLTGDGIVNMTDPKQNFNPGSFVFEGQQKSGFIAWCKPNEIGEYYAFYFTEKRDGPANIYYTSKGAGNVQQEITEEIKPYDPLEDSYLATKTIDKEVNNGYVITASNEKIEGAVQLSFPPKLWFATDVTLTKTDGTVIHYRNDGSLRRIVVTIDGVEKEFVNYDNAYAEVLHRDETLVHFRNPHPTTPTLVSQITQQVVGDFLNELDKEMQAYAAATGNDPSEAGLTNRQGEKVDWTNVEVFKMYEKEYIIMDEKDGRHTMYIPNKSFYRMDYELMGCIEYLTLDRGEQAVLRKVQNPIATMKFINANMNN